MSRENANPQIPLFVVRHFVGLLALLSLLFIIQTGIVPFDFNRAGELVGNTEAFGASTDRVTGPDIIFNIFLYVPLGLLVHAGLHRIGIRKSIALLLAVVMGAALSFAIEWAQHYMPSRVSSLIDLVSNILGTVIGATISITAGWVLPKFFGALLFEFNRRPRIAAVKTYGLILVLAAMMPFSMAFDMGRIKQAAKNANFIPFSTASDSFHTPDKTPTVKQQQRQDYQRWASMKRWSRWTAELFSFAVLSWLFQPVLFSHYRFTRNGAFAMIIWTGFALAVVLSIIQFFVVTRGLDVTDILFRWAGVVFGAVACATYHRREQSWAPDTQARIWRGVAALVLVYIVYTGIIPLSFDSGWSSIDSSLSSTNLLPFFGYFMTRFDVMMDDVLEKFVAYMVFAVALAACLASQRRKGFAGEMVPVAIAGLVLSVAIEAVQLFMSIRITSITDPIIAVSACVVGVVVKNQAVLFYEFAKSHDMSGPDTRDREPQTTMGPLDEMLATLTEPNPDAPRESVPKKPPSIPRS
ncbi:MAG: VanZ family protein [Planctomycetota bacterium]|jgi:VanZ family protein